MDKKFLYCRIAGIEYQIEYQYSYIERAFEDYIINEDESSGTDNIVKINYSDEDIRRCESLHDEKRSPGYIEYICIMDKIATLLPDQGMFLMHGAVVEYKGKAYIFTAPSGTGKTTHISLWKKHLGDNLRIINGDKPEVSFDDKNVYVHGAPWCGKERWQINTSATLAGVCLIMRGKENIIKKINPGKNIEFFISQLYFAPNSESMLKVIDLFGKMTKRVPFYQLECDISEDAAKCSFEAMTGEKWSE